MAPKELEKVLYFAASIVTWVDDEARERDLAELEGKVNEAARRLRRRARGARARAPRAAGASRGVPRERRPEGLRRRGPPVGRGARRRRQEARRRRALQDAQGPAQDVRVRHLRHRGVHRGRRRAHAPGLGALQGDGARSASSTTRRSSASSRSASAPRTASASTSAAAWAPRRSATCSSRSTSRPRPHRARGDHPHRQGPEAGPRGQAPEGRRRVHPVRQPPGADGARGRPGHPAGAAPDGPARRRPVRHVGPQRPLPPRHQPQQPPQAAARPRRAGDHRQQREADAAGGRRRAVRQRPPRPARHGPGQPSR